MLPQAIRRPFPAPSLAVFFSLQVLDVLTTLIGLSVGAQEASAFVGRLLQVSPVTGLIIPKLFSLLLVVSAIRFKRQRLIVFLNYWFAALVTWNLGTIMMLLMRR
jgi:hypothetical protein